jgi:subtilisin family serine protease
MPTRKLSTLGIAAAMALCLALPGSAGTVHSYIIEGTGNSLPNNLGAMVGAAGGVLQRVHPEIGVAQATSADPGFAGKLAGASGIQSVAQDTIVQWTPPRSAAVQGTVALANPPAAAPNPQGAFFYGCQWNLQQINAPGAWAQGDFGGPRVKVAVLDTGVDPNHIDLSGKIDTADSVSELTPGSSPCGSADETSFIDFDFHGTFVSSQIVGNLIGMASVAPKSSVVMVKVLNCQGSGSFGDVIAGIRYAANLKDVDIINMSLGAYIPKAGNDALIDAIGRATLYAQLHGKLVVVASGNSATDLTFGSPNVELPAQSPGAIAVNATNIQDTLASYSNFGPATWVDAPGGDLPDPVGPLPGCPIAPAGEQSLVLGACAASLCGGENFYLIGAGTSFASPLAAGVSALIDQAAGRPISFFPEYAQLILALTADKIGPFSIYANGRINAGKAVASEGFH